MDRKAYDFINNINSQINLYDNKLVQINQIENERSELIAEVCYSIFMHKEEIITLINENIQYLNFLSSGAIVPRMISDIDNDLIKTEEQVKMLLQILRAIISHQNHGGLSDTPNTSNNMFSRFVQIVKEDLYDN